MLLLFYFPLLVWAQKDEIFAKLVNEDGSVIMGSSGTQFYEKQIPLFILLPNLSFLATKIHAQD